MNTIRTAGAEREPSVASRSRKSAPSMAEIEHPFVARVAQTERKTILLADDSSSVRESLTRLLESAVYHVIAVSNGSEALRRVEREAIDLLLLDLGMPGLDGWETLRQLRSLSARLPVIVMTGHSAQRSWVQQLGARGLIEKPLEPAVVLELIHDVFTEISFLSEQETTSQPRFRWWPAQPLTPNLETRNWGLNE